MGLPLNNKLQLLQLVFLLAVHHVNLLPLTDSSACNTTCANLGTDLYPFASTSSPSACALSSSFLLSNCSSEQAYWDGFTTAIPSYYIAQNIIGPPAVMRISRVNYSTYINVAWDSDLISQPNKYISACSTPPVPLINLSHSIPPFIDLSPFAPSILNVDVGFPAFRISRNTVYLILNCTTPNLVQRMNSLSATSNQTLETNTALCQSYRSHCTLRAEYYTSPCVQLSFDPSELYSQLSLQNVMGTLACTHFQFFVTKTGPKDVAVTEWSKAILQLQWTDPNCILCIDSGGSCVLDSTNHTLKQCTNCTYGEGADGLSCNFPVCEGQGGFSICYTRTKIVVSLLAIAGTVLVLLALYYWRRIYRRRRSKQKSLTKFPPRSAWAPARAPLQELSSGSNESLHELDLSGLSERPMEYSYSLIASATSSFSSKVGEGGFGAVFKGALDNTIDDQGGGVQQEIAVKVLEVRSKHSRKQFLNEVTIIGRIHHVNVVRLLGFCVEREAEHEMLVYEYVVNGSLDTWLFSPSKRAGPGDHYAAEKERLLEWGQRYGIALGVARGLSYLHEECRHRIVHCDVKPQNILLDASMCPKIADFGLARLMTRDESRVVTLAKGTPGYMAPEFWVGGDIHLSTKADVYSYGMVLLEIISGRRNFAFGCRRFPAVAFEAAMRGDFESLLDAHLQGATAEEERYFLMWQQVRTAIFVALWCIQEHPASRPCMSEVVQYLEGIAAVSEQPPLPAVASTSITSPLPPIIGLDSNSHLRDQTPPISQGR